MTKAYFVPVSVKGVVLEGDFVWLRKNERGEWELPGGKIDAGEQPEEAVVREFREELGFDVAVKDIIKAHVLKIPNSLDESEGVLVLIFACELLTKTGAFEFKGEAGVAEFKKFRLSEIEKLRMPQFYKEAIKKVTATIKASFT